MVFYGGKYNDNFLAKPERNMGRFCVCFWLNKGNFTIFVALNHEESGMKKHLPILLLVVFGLLLSALPVRAQQRFTVIQDTFCINAADNKCFLLDG